MFHTGKTRMTMTKAARVASGLKVSEARFIKKISAQDLKTIMKGLSDAIQAPDAFTNEALSLGADGKMQDVFSPQAVQLDLLGWILKLSYQHWSELRSGRRTIGHVVSMYIDSHIRTVSGDTLRLITLGDAGPAYASRYLRHAAEKLQMDALPALFSYAKDYESEEDKEKRLAKAAERKAKLLAKRQAIIKEDH